MRNVCLGVIGGILISLAGGCDPGKTVETNMPTTPQQNPPEAEQIKKDMEKRFPELGGRGGPPAAKK